MRDASVGLESTFALYSLNSDDIPLTLDTVFAPLPSKSDIMPDNCWANATLEAQRGCIREGLSHIRHDLNPHRALPCRAHRAHQFQPASLRLPHPAEAAA